MKKIYIPLSLMVLLLSACDDGGFNAVSENIPKAVEEAPEEMTATVQVHSVAGSADGIVFKEDDRSKWIVTEASVFRDHPKALIITSEKQQLEGTLEAFDIESNTAIVHIRNSALVEAQEQPNQQQLEKMLEAEAITAEERYTLHEAFAEQEVSQKYGGDVIVQYEKETFEYNPDALQHFVTQFNSNYNKYVATGDFEAIKGMLLSDLLVEAFATAEDKRYIESFTATVITKAGFEWVVQGTSDDFNVTYKINRVDGTYYITYFMIEE